MLTALRNIRARFRELEMALRRVEVAQAIQSDNNEALLGEIKQLQRAQADARNEANQSLGHILGVVDHVQLLAGETLSAVNDFRMHNMATADLLRQAIGRIETRQILSASDNQQRWHENEFRVYSQFGEDGLLQYLFKALPHAPRTFVEFGVEDYKEANTRFLLLNDRSWAGLVLDGSEENVAEIRKDMAYLRYNLKAVSAWIDRNNINDLLRKQGFEGEIGLLSVDIDGNDLWIWEAITVVNPVVVVVEYNYRFGPVKSVAVPYDPKFDKGTAHDSGIYYGASLQALVTLADKKGYGFVGCSSGGVNAFFVRRDHLNDTITEVPVSEGFAAGQHAEMRDAKTGDYIKAPLEVQMQLLLSLPLVSVDTDSFLNESIILRMNKDLFKYLEKGRHGGC